MLDAVLGPADAPERAEREAEAVRDTPLRRFGTVEEVAALVVYLASDESGYTTGAAFVLDGGLLGDDSTPICARWTRTGPVTAGGPCRHNRAADGPGDGTVADSPPEHERHQTPEYEHDAPLQGRGQRDGVDYGGACDHPALNPLHQ